ncbi:hypothetical protein LCGC14_2682200 [marine sediment metagenome]|uniref:Uncharacterized protein n=1 Tax=marine sediment metagenome TaxID=412755 RepID=A0A0F8ZL26_9ZZZZ
MTARPRKPRNTVGTAIKLILALQLGVGGLLYFAFVETRPIIEAILKADLVEDTEQDA